MAENRKPSLVGTELKARDGASLDGALRGTGSAPRTSLKGRDVHAEFLAYAQQRPELLRRETFSSIVDQPGMEYYQLQGWPTWVSSGELAVLEQASVALCRLIKGIPERIFGDDPAAISDFFDLESAAQAALLLEPPNGIESAIGRVDFIQTSAGMQCMEVNLGNLGMWQTTLLGSRFLELPAVDEFLRGHGLRAASKNATASLFRHVIDVQMKRYPDWSGPLNLGIVVSPHGVCGPGCHLWEDYRPLYARLLAERGFEGDVYVASETDIVEVAGGLAFDGIPLHMLVEQHEEFTTQKLFRASKSGQVSIYNGAVDRILSDKRNIAILSEFSEAPIFDAEESRIMREFVPWTRIVTGALVSFRGKEVSMPDLLVEERESLVLKKSISFGGRHVVIGAHESAADWRKACEAALDEAGGWIVQELIPPRSEKYLAADGVARDYDTVWGLFVFGDTHAGAVVRMIPSRDPAVINTSQGANVGLVYEVEPTQSRGARVVARSPELLRGALK